MSEVFPLFYPANLHVYDAKHCGYAIGERCAVCNARMVFRDCISPCLCYRFAHEDCLLKVLNQENGSGEERKYSCKDCGWRVGVKGTPTLGVKCQCRGKNVIGCGVGGVLTFLLIYLICGNRLGLDQGQLMGLSFLLMLTCTVFLMALANLILVRRITLTNVCSTEMDMDFSAFRSVHELRFASYAQYTCD